MKIDSRTFIKLSIILLLLFLNFNKAKSQFERIVRIDPQSAKGGKVLDIFDSVSYIPLETTKESQFGEINQLIVTEENYIILDNRTTNCILIFTKDGKFKAKINKWKGHSPDFLSNKPYKADGKW